MDGHQYYPKVQCSKIRFPTGTTRETETLTLSLFYPNNLLNSFLYRFNKDRFITPLCGCGEGEQDATHVLTQCKMVKAVTKRKLVSLITEDFPIDTLRPFFSDWSKDPGFIQLCVTAIRSCKDLLVKEIILKLADDEESTTEERGVECSTPTV